jgi:hypothetical protein
MLSHLYLYLLWAHQLIDAAEVTANVLTTVNTGPATESQTRPLASLAPEQQREAWTAAVETAPNGKPTAAHVSAYGAPSGSRLPWTSRRPTRPQRRQ